MDPSACDHCFITELSSRLETISQHPWHEVMAAHMGSYGFMDELAGTTALTILCDTCLEKSSKSYMKLSLGLCLASLEATRHVLRETIIHHHRQTSMLLIPLDICSQGPLPLVLTFFTQQILGFGSASNNMTIKKTLSNVCRNNVYFCT